MQRMYNMDGDLSLPIPGAFIDNLSLFLSNRNEEGQYMMSINEQVILVNTS